MVAHSNYYYIFVATRVHNWDINIQTIYTACDRCKLHELEGQSSKYNAMMK